MTPTCPTCGLELPRSPFLPDQKAGTSSPCYLCTNHPTADPSLVTERVKFINNLPAAVGHFMAMAEVPKRLRKARWEEVYPEIQTEFPMDQARMVARGEIPVHGWGLIGDFADGKPTVDATYGAGKSAAIAALLTKHIRGFLARRLPAWLGDGLDFPSSRIAWVDWPETYSWLQSHAIEDETPERIERLKRARILILDDLGRERFPKDSKSRVGFGHDALFQVIAHRNSAEAPILWTSNYRIESLQEMYGEAVMSRLVEDNLPSTVPHCGNRRLL